MLNDLKFTTISAETTVATTERPVEAAPAKGMFSKDSMMNFVPLLLVFAIFFISL